MEEEGKRRDAENGVEIRWEGKANQIYKTNPGRDKWAMLRVFRAVFLNRRAAALYRALPSIIPGRERFSLEFVILIF